ncbi:MAG: hypothetical protein V4607_04085 [Pseudomonadota bacterium]
MLLAACGNEPIQLHNELSWSSASLQRSPSCQFSLAAVTDRTQSSDKIGAIGNAPVLASDVVGWVRAAFEQIPGHSQQPQNLSLDVELVRSYIHALSVSKSANVVIRVNYLRPAQNPITRAYRGADTSMNWFSSDSEVQSAFNRALKEMAQQVAGDLGQFCESANSR